MRKTRQPLALLALLLAIASCAPARSGVFTLASTKQGAEALGSHFVLVKKDATATVTTPVIFFPMGVPRDFKAMEQILADNQGDLLTNVRVTSKFSMFYFIFFFGSTKITVNADVWRAATRSEIESGGATELRSLNLGGDVFTTPVEPVAWAREEGAR